MKGAGGEVARRALRDAKRVVVKVGTRVLVDGRGRPDEARLRALVDGVVALHAEGREVVLVSSGAIGAGLEALGLQKRPKTLPDLQMAAAVGQLRLWTRYAELFSEKGCTVGQVLLTHEDLQHRLRHLNARHTMMKLLRNRIVPIVNENDVVAVDEIKFGDNDHLASLVAMLVEADLLVLLTTVEGLQAPVAAGAETRVRVPFLSQVTEATLGWTWKAAEALSRGGMASKLQAAQAASSVGIPVVIASGLEPDVLSRVVAGGDCGTLVAAAPGPGAAVRSKKRWIAFFNRPEGSLTIDDGARGAVVERGKSLLPIGVRAVEGDFAAGAVVSVRALGGEVVARGLADYGSDDIRTIKGQRTDAIAGLLGERSYDEVIHRDNMVVLDPGERR